MVSAVMAATRLTGTLEIDEGDPLMAARSSRAVRTRAKTISPCDGDATWLPALFHRVDAVASLRAETALARRLLASGWLSVPALAVKVVRASVRVARGEEPAVDAELELDRVSDGGGVSETVEASAKALAEPPSRRLPASTVGGV